MYPRVTEIPCILIDFFSGSQLSFYEYAINLYIIKSCDLVCLCYRYSLLFRLLVIAVVKIITDKITLNR